MPEEVNSEDIRVADEREYTRQDVIYQSLAAFGQGTQYMRISSRACGEFARLMELVDEARNLHESWGTVAVQVLERVRAIGRVACALAIQEGETVILEEYIGPSFRKVQLISKTEFCDQDDPPVQSAAFP